MVKTGEASNKEKRWRFLSNHSYVLICLARNSDRSMREVALEIGITERAVQRIVQDLAAARYLKKVRRGRKNHYEVDASLPMRHLLTADRKVSSVIELGSPQRQKRLKLR